jgi:hypothetical protein
MAATSMPGTLHGTNSSLPAGRMAAVTPSDTVSFTYLTRGLYVGVAGNVYVNALAEDGVTLAACAFIGVAAGTILPITCDRVNSTNTTATNIVALW